MKNFAITLSALFALLLASCQPAVQQDSQARPVPLSAETAENYENYDEAVRYIDAAKPPRIRLANQPQPSLVNYDDFPMPAEVEAAIKYLTNEITQMKANLIDGSPGAMDKIKEIAEETISEFPKIANRIRIENPRNPR